MVRPGPPRSPGVRPDLHLRGAAVGGVPADLGALARSLDGGPAAYFGLLGVIGLDAAYPDAIRLDERLDDRGRAVVAQLRTECVGGPGTLATAFTSVQDHTADGSTLDQLLAEPDIAAVIAANDLGAGPPRPCPSTSRTPAPTRSSRWGRRSSCTRRGARPG